MKTPIELKKGDRCPNCGGEFMAAPTPTAEQRQRAADRENPEQLPPHFDSATDAQREQLGALYKCGSCGYKARLPLEGQARPGQAASAGSSSQGSQGAGQASGTARPADRAPSGHQGAESGASEGGKDWDALSADEQRQAAEAYHRSQQQNA